MKTTKKIFNIILLILMIFCLGSCKSNNNQTENKEFKPKLDTSTACKIKIVGNYSNFEALEAEFDLFNNYYPNVELSYTKIDDYNNSISTVLNGKDAPNIFFSFSAMFSKSSYEDVFAHMENLADPTLGLDLDCIRTGLLPRNAAGQVLSVPIFSTSYGMLINNDLFKKEEIKVPKTFAELLDVCNAFKTKGYESPIMGYSRDSSSCLMYIIAYPIFVASLAKNPEMISLANQGDASAGGYMRQALTIVSDLIDNDCINLEKCNEIKDNYNEVVLRFFEGDVPMMICTGDTVSGTSKRESRSTAFTEHPFTYSFMPVPTTANGGYFSDSPSVQFSVNKDCENLDMTNEFMRFLITNEELNRIASVKRLISPTNDLSYDKVYSAVGDVPSELIISPTALGIEDPIAKQIRLAAFKVATGALTIDEAISQYGSLS